MAEELSARIQAAIRSTGLVTSYATQVAAEAVIKQLGLVRQTEEIGADCPECDPYTMTRWVTTWEVVDG